MNKEKQIGSRPNWDRNDKEYVFADLTYYTMKNVGYHWEAEEQILHSYDGLPSCIIYSPDGQIIRHQWHCDGMLYNRNSPADIKYSAITGEVIYEAYYEDVSSEDLHRVGGPAITIRNGNFITEKWYHHGQLHRFDGPAKIDYSNTFRKEEWFVYGKKLNSKKVKNILGDDISLPLSYDQHVLLKMLIE